MTKAKLTKEAYIKRFGIEKYVVKQYRPKYREVAMKKLTKAYPKAHVFKPPTVKPQPYGLMEYQNDVRSKMRKKNISYKKASKMTHDSEKWTRRRRFQGYPAEVKRWIEATYDKKRESGEIKVDQSLSDWLGES